jgi:hypothetical protein
MLAVFFAICFLPACKRTETPDPAAQKAKDLAALPRAESLDGLLVAESRARLQDSDTVTLELVAQALKAQGIELGPSRQLMARTQLALYCARADSPTGLDVTVCEYPSAEQAQRGEQEGNAVMNKVAGHSSRVRGKSVLHVVRRSDTPDADVEKVYAAFQGVTLDAGR